MAAGGNVSYLRSLYENPDTAVFLQADTGDEADFDEHQMNIDNGPIVALPTTTITEAKQKNVVKSDEKCPDLEARIILNKNIHHSVITALQFASHGLVPNDEYSVRCVACSSVIQLNLLLTLNCLLSAHERSALGKGNSNRLTCCYFVIRQSLLVELTAIFEKRDQNLCAEVGAMKEKIEIAADKLNSLIATNQIPRDDQRDQTSRDKEYRELLENYQDLSKRIQALEEGDLFNVKLGYGTVASCVRRDDNSDLTTTSVIPEDDHPCP